MRTRKGKKISLFNILLSIFITAGVLVFFVYNIIHVNGLAVEMNNYNNDLNKQIILNNALQNEIERLSTYDNIKQVAIDKLHLDNLSNKPKKIIVNKSELDNLK